MDDKIPLQIRRDVRDHWEKPTSPAREAIKKLSETIGFPVQIELDAGMLWAELQRSFPDRATFVPSVVGVLLAWVQCLGARLADESASEAWVEEFLERLKAMGSRVVARVVPVAGTRVETRLPANSDFFVINIPNTPPPYRAVAATFNTDLENLFKGSGGAEEDDGWARVDVSSSSAGGGGGGGRGTSYGGSGSRKSNNMAIGAAGGATTPLPTLDTLPRPENLFAAVTPYWMIVRSVGSDEIHVQGSHQPGMELLAGYLEKYVRTPSSYNRKFLKFELQESHYGIGLLMDSLIISGVISNIRVNPVLVLAFIEGVLGYALQAEACSGGQWVFRREKAYSA